MDLKDKVLLQLFNKSNLLKSLKQVYEHNTRLPSKLKFCHCSIRTNLGKRLF